MKFTVLAIGKLKEQYLRDGVAEFVKRLRVYGGVTITELSESKMSGSGDRTARLQAVNDEGERLLKGVSNHAYVVLLDVYGKTTSSEALAARSSWPATAATRNARPTRAACCTWCARATIPGAWSI